MAKADAQGKGVAVADRGPIAGLRNDQRPSAAGSCLCAETLPEIEAAEDCLGAVACAAVFGVAGIRTLQAVVQKHRGDLGRMDAAGKVP